MFEKMVLMYSAYTLVIATAVSYGIYKLISPKGKPTSAKQYGQLWAAWVVALTNFRPLSKFLIHLNVDTFAIWLLVSIIFFGGISFSFGYIYGKIRIKIKNNAIDATNQKIETETNQSKTINRTINRQP